MPYTKTNWQDNSSPPIDAANLNNMESGIAAAPYGPDALVHQVPVSDGAGGWLYQLIKDAEIDPSAAIAYAKLNLALSIKNADIAANAAIAVTKIANPNDPTLFLRGDATWAAPATAPGIPSGTIVQYGGSAAPTNWLMCDGAAVSRTTYAALFTALGTTYGAGDGSTTFNVPDLRGRVPVGYASGGKTEVATLGHNDGLAENLRNISHHHTFEVNAFSSGGGAENPVGSGGSSFSVSGDSDNTDKPAYLVVNFIVKT